MANRVGFEPTERKAGFEALGLKNTKVSNAAVKKI